jgi:hypothetical protein
MPGWRQNLLRRRGAARISSAEAWAKYTGAADYDQPLHRDYLNTEATLAGTAQRYSGLDMSPWRQSLRGEA